MPLLWMDRKRPYFFSTSGTLLPFQIITRFKYALIGNSSKGLIMKAAILEAVQTYYQASSEIDTHGRCRQDNLNIEKTFELQSGKQRFILLRYLYLYVL